jgi:hypothetical protein
VLIDMTHDEPCRSENEDCDVPSELIAVEGRFVMNDVTARFLATEGRVEGFGHNVRVVATALDVLT